VADEEGGDVGVGGGAAGHVANEVNDGVAVGDVGVELGEGVAAEHIRNERVTNICPYDC
jgi:hypothetical protein